MQPLRSLAHPRLASRRPLHPGFGNVKAITGGAFRQAVESVQQVGFLLLGLGQASLTAVFRSP